MALYNDIRPNKTQCPVTQHNKTRYHDTQHNDIQCNKKLDTQHCDAQHNDQYCYAKCLVFDFAKLIVIVLILLMVNVVILSVLYAECCGAINYVFTIGLNYLSNVTKEITYII